MYEPDSRGFAAVEARAGERESTRLREPDALHQEWRDLRRRNPESGFGQGETRVGAADRNVRDRNETEAAAVNGAFDHGDDGLRNRIHARQKFTEAAVVNGDRIRRTARGRWRAE